MNAAIERRLDNVLLFDKIAYALRLIRGEQQREAIIAERRRVSRVPGAIVQFIPSHWLGQSVSHSYATRVGKFEAASLDNAKTAS
jgi:hypothetical protein